MNLRRATASAVVGGHATFTAFVKGFHAVTRTCLTLPSSLATTRCSEIGFQLTDAPHWNQRWVLGANVVDERGARVASFHVGDNSCVAPFSR